MSYLDELKAQNKELQTSIKDLDATLSDYEPGKTPDDKDVNLKDYEAQLANEYAKQLNDIEDQQLVTGKEQLEETKYLSNTADEISAKLSVLSERLKVKYDAASPDAPPVVRDNSTAEVLADRLDAQSEEQPKKQAWMPQPMPVEKKPSDDLLSKSEDKGSKEGVKGAPNESTIPMIAAVKGVGSVVKAGFNKSIGIVDKISNLLFKMSVKQIADAALMGAAIFGIILSIDLLKAAWAAWGEKIMAKVEEWTTIFKGWWEGFKGWASSFSDLTTAFEGMRGDFMGIRNAWESGDWPSLAKALGTTIKDGLMTLSGILDRLFTKVLSTILDKVGLGKAAKAVEAEGLQRYQGKTNNKLSDENQKKLAEEQIRREKKDGLTPTQRGLTSFLPDKMRKGWALTDNEYNQIQAEKKDKAATKNLSHDDQVKVTAATNEAREAVARFKNIADNYDPNKKDQAAQFDKYKKEAQAYISKPELAKSPAVKAELEAQVAAISKGKGGKASVAPEKSANSQDSGTVKNIKVAEAQRAANKNASPAGNTVIQTNVAKTNKNVHVQAPVTSTTAPGVYGATKVN
ncbi:baseplate hub subunit and tail length [Acinetobacter phage Acj9]|uniref:Gp29 baseplate hub subunit n=1 Tax=Acinetobacter phage Acj9 TaxID=760939 RepID=E5EPY5_9CAUD|nr:baseplate hub subunit and tail length [Acinetobacter phage Acj9]ADG60101.1 gp29 baseplate hub subunit [Acinetobacter phage Acj9]